MDTKGRKATGNVLKNRYGRKKLIETRVKSMKTPKDVFVLLGISEGSSRARSMADYAEDEEVDVQ